jgi:hypothetical protein
MSGKSSHQPKELVRNDEAIYRPTYPDDILLLRYDTHTMP